MLLEFIAAIALGLGLAGLVMITNRLAGKRLPGWLAPASAGLGMIAFMVYLEYSWADRTMARLPEGVVLASASSESMWYRPWTYIKPLSLRLIAIDTRRNRSHDDRPGQIMTTIVLLGRWMPIREVPVVFDCVNARRADLTDQVSIETDGELIGAQWRRLSVEDPALLRICS